MSVFDLDTRGQQQLDETARMNPLDLSQVDAGFWKGTGKGIGMGVMRGAAAAAKATDILVAAPVALFEQATGQDGKYTDNWFRAVDDNVGSAVDYWTPGAHEVGAAGRVLGGLSEIVPQLMATGGNPALMLASQTTNPAADLAAKGVDANLATTLGLVQGASAAVGFRMPFLGETLASRMLSGVAGNLATNAGATALQHDLLDYAGREDLAAQYNPLDLEARAVDVLTGLAFGGMAHVMTPSSRAAVASAANAKHYQADTAPGKPADLAAHVAHQEAIEQAVGAVLRGEPVVPPPEVAAARFEPVERPAVEVPRELRALDEAMVEPDPFATKAPEEVQRLDDLQTAIGYIQPPPPENGRGIVPDHEVFNNHERYQAAVDAVGGRIGIAGHPAWASRPSKDMKPPEARAAVDKAIAGQPLTKREQRFVDHMLEYVAQERAYVRDVPEQGRITQEDRAAADLQAADQQLAQLAVRARHLGADPDMVDAALESQSDAIAAEKLNGLIAEVEQQSRASQEPAASDGNAGSAPRPKDLFGADAGRQDQLTARNAQIARKLGEGRAQPPPGGMFDAAAKADAASKQTDVVVEAARAAAAATDLRVPTGEIDADGNPVTVSAAELLARGDEEIAQAQKDAAGFGAAISCFLSTGIQ